MRLFAERAAAVKPGFQVTAENAAAVAAVVRRLDGIALAIELAAARVPAMTPAELARRLERSFAVLAAGRRGAVARHQTLRATIDWSFQLLAGPEQALLARLAVFAGGATLEAVEAVCGGEGIDPDAVFELLAGLVARSLVVAEEHGPRDPLPAAGDDPPVRRGTPRGGRGGRAVAGPPRRLLRGPPPPGPRPRPRPSRGGVLGGPAQRRAGQPARGVVVGDRHRQRRHRVSDPGRLRAGRGLEHLPAAAGRRSGPGAARRGRAPGLPARPGGQRRVRVRSRGCDRRRGAVPPGGRRQRAPGHPGLAGRGDHLRRPLRTSRSLPARSPTPPASPNRPPVSRGPAATSPTPPSSSPSPWLITCSPVTRPRRSRWRARHSRWPARSAPRPSSRPACSPWARPSPSTDPGQARACLRESRELSTALGYQSAIDLVWATAIAFLVGDQAATLELGRRAIRGLQWGGDRIRMGLVLYMIAGALAATRPDAAAIIQGAAEAYVVESPRLRPADQLDRDGSPGRGARAGTPRPRRGHGLGPGHRLHPHPDHPGPQRTRIRDPAISELPLQGSDIPAVHLGHRPEASPVSASLRAIIAGDTFLLWGESPRSWWGTARS